MKVPPRFELGCNYWPRCTAMYMWRELDLAEVRDELAHLRDLGFKVVRFFLLTQDFLPEPTRVSIDMLRRLVEVARIASEERLATIPTLITINMSGKLWWPAWLNEPRASLFADPSLLRAQALLVERCADALAGDSSVRAFDLSNELDDAQPVPSRDAGWLWAALLAAAVRRAAPGVPIQVGAHLPSLRSTTHLRIDDLSSVVDEDCMHAYPLYCDAAESFLDPELVPFSCALTSALSGSGRPTLMHEFGICTAPPGSAGVFITDDFLGRPRRQYLASEEDGAHYYAQVLERLVATGAAGAYAWCYADYHPRLFARAPFDSALRERSFGLIRADGTEKPAAGVFRRFANQLAKGELVMGVTPPVLDIAADAYYASPRDHFSRLYARWLGRPPCAL